MAVKISIPIKLTPEETIALLQKKISKLEGDLTVIKNKELIKECVHGDVEGGLSDGK